MTASLTTNTTYHNERLGNQMATQTPERIERLVEWERSGRTPPELPDTGQLNLIHADLVTILGRQDQTYYGEYEERRDALARVLAYVSRGSDLAFLLGFSE